MVNGVSKKKQLSDALESLDLKSAYHLSSEFLKKDPANQQYLKLKIYSAKHDKHLFPEIYPLRSRVRFDDSIEEPLDFEALLMLVDVIEACGSLAEAISFIGDHVEKVGGSNEYYLELFFSSIGVKFAQFNEEQLAAKYHQHAIKIRGSYLSLYNYGHFLIRFGALEDAIPYYRSRWQWEKFPSIERKFRIPCMDLDALDSYKDSRVLIWCEQGIGDQILWTQVIKYLIERGWAKLTLECHAKLTPLMRASFPGINVIAQPQTREGYDSIDDTSFSHLEFDCHIPLVELFLKVNKSISEFKTVAPFLATRDDWAVSLRNTILADQPGKLIIGLHWSSSVVDPVRARAFLVSEDLQQLTALNEKAVFVSFNYAAKQEDIDSLRSETGLNIISVTGVDHKNDLLSATALMRSCDGFIGVTGSPTWQAAYVGVPTVLVEFSDNASKPFPRAQMVHSFRRLLGINGQKRDCLQHLVENFSALRSWFLANRNI